MIGLTPEQRAGRRFFLGGSDSPIVCNGTPEQRLNLYLEKTGDLDIAADPTWTRYMQQVVEVAALDWVEEFGCRDAGGVQAIPPGPMTRRGEQPTSQIWPFIGCTLDGYGEAVNCPVNVKHLSKWSGKTAGLSALEWAIEKYTIGTIHEALACGSEAGYLLLVIDGKEPIAQRIEADPWFAAELVAKERAFWHCVETKTPPEGGEVLAAPKIEISQMRRLNFLNPEDRDAANWSGDFIDLAHTFAETEAAHRKHMIIRDKVKALLPDDVAQVDYGRFHVTRSKAGAVTQRLDEEATDAGFHPDR